MSSKQHQRDNNKKYTCCFLSKVCYKSDSRIMSPLWR